MNNDTIINLVYTSKCQKIIETESFAEILPFRPIPGDFIVSERQYGRQSQRLIFKVVSCTIGSTSMTLPGGDYVTDPHLKIELGLTDYMLEEMGGASYKDWYEQFLLDNA